MIPGVRKFREAIKKRNNGNQEARNGKGTNGKEETPDGKWQPWENPSGGAVPVFLLGCLGSGMTMLMKHLDRSWRVTAYNEDNQDAFKNWRLRDPSVIKALVKRSPSEAVLFKPIFETHKAQLLLANFPNARIIFTFRHYDDVINSSIRRFGAAYQLIQVNSWIKNDFKEFAGAKPPKTTMDMIRSKWNPTLSCESGAALYWLFYNQLYFDLGLHRDKRVRLVSYEAVVSNPAREIREICEFTGTCYDARSAVGIFSKSTRRSPVPKIAPNILVACEKLWRRLYLASNGAGTVYVPLAGNSSDLFS